MNQCGKPYKGHSLCSMHLERVNRGVSLNGFNKTSPNEIRVGTEYAEMDLYGNDNAVRATTIFDLEDMKRISAFRWGAGAGYVRRKNPNAPPSGILLHRWLMEPVPKGLVIDHLNRDKLDNRKKNLRVVTVQENTWNKGGNPGIRMKNGTWLAKIERKFLTMEEAMIQRVTWEESRI